MRVRESVKNGWGIAVSSMNLVLILFVFGAVWNVINVLVTPGLQTSETPNAGASALLIGLAVIFGLISIYMQAGSLNFIYEKLVKGSSDVAAFKSGGAKFYVKLFVLGLIVAGIVGSLVLLAALCVAVFPQNLNVIGIILAVILALIGIYVAIQIFLAPYIIVADGQGPMAAVKQSMALVKKNILSILGIAGFMIVIGFGFGIVLGALLAGLSAVLSTGNIAQLLFAVVSSFVNAFLGVMVSGAFMSFYLSLKSSSGKL